jgi:probable F420-dependent oxidoreductase
VKLGALFPQAEIGADLGALREYVKAAEDIGYDHLVAYDHVLGVRPVAASAWSDAFAPTDAFYEPLVLFAYCAAFAPRLSFVSSVLVLPQRQTALVAKQAAQLDVLSGGRLRLGVGIGWNDAEYAGLGMEFSNRARRIEEQIGILRALWQHKTVTVDGRFDRLAGAAISPLPIQRPIPIWMGGSAERALKRAAELADGFLPMRPLPDRPLESEWPAVLARMSAWRRAAGGDPGSFGLEPSLRLAERGPVEWRQTAEEWRTLGATHLYVSTVGVEGRGIGAHVERLELAWAALRELREPDPPS